MKHVAKLFSIIFYIAIIVSAFNPTVAAYTDEEMETNNYRIVNTDDIHVTSEHDIGYNFTDFQRAMYNELRAFLASVANGETSSTILQVRVDIASFNWEKDTVYDNMMALIDDVNIWQALVSSCPYEFFWRGWVVGCSWSEIDLASNEYFYVTFSMLVSEEYRGENEYTVSAEAVASGKAAAATAKAIVAKYENVGDLEKLQGYIDEIAALATYGRQGDYGPHDNLVYVFDGNLNTTVACEGYAKAFKYLCDLSTFDKDIYCHIVFGEDHMWNVVEIDGNNYLLDASWYDTVDGHPYKEYFLAGGVSSDGGQTMMIKSHTGRTETRSYDASERDRHCAGYLVLSETDYHEHKYSEAWTSDGTQHWHECSCGDKIDVASHTSLKQSDACTQRTLCEVCDAPFGDLLPHVYDQQNITDEYLKVPASCTHRAEYYFSCKCGAKSTETFCYGDLQDHCYTVQNTNYTYLKSSATCTESAEYYYSCECGKTGTDFFSYGEPNSHSYDANGVCASCGDVIVVDKPTETPDVDDNCGNVGTDDDALDADNNKDDTPDIDVSPDLDDQIDAPSDNSSNNDKKGGLLDRFIKLLIELLIEFIKFLFT